MTIPKTITLFAWRVIVFLGLFVSVSGLIGPKIIAGHLLRSGAFEIYGSIGKALIFATIAFMLLVWHKRHELRLYAWHKRHSVWFGVAAAAFTMSWFAVDVLLSGHHSFGTLLLAHAGLWLCFGGIVLGCFGRQNILSLWRTYKQELLIALACGAVFYLFLMLVYALWQPLAIIVTSSVSWLLEATGHVSFIVPPNKLILDKFGITIAESCSGIESIALFTSLYAIVGLLERDRINKKYYFGLFPAALLVLFLLNIARVYGLVFAGYHINKEIAFSLFHTYAGMVFFIVYSAFFWLFAYKYITNAPES